MTDRKQFEAMLEALINEDQETAKELFHNIVVAKSREIYEELLENDFGASEDDGKDKEDDKEDGDIGGDATDSFADEIEDDADEAEDDAEDIKDDAEESEGEDEDVEDRVQDLEDALEDLKAEFEQMLKGEEHEEEGEPGIHGEGEPMHDIEGDMDGGEPEVEDESMGDTKTIHHVHHDANDTSMPYEESYDSDEQLIREYVEKVGMNWESATTSQEGGHVGAVAGGQNGPVNARSTVNGSMVNDMGGTTSNIAQTGTPSNVYANKGQLSGNAVLKGTVVDNPDAKGNINVPGGKAGKTAFKTQVKGGGIDRQAGFDKPGKEVGAKDSSGKGESNTQSSIRPRK